MVSSQSGFAIANHTGIGNRNHGKRRESSDGEVTKESMTSL